MAVTPNNAIVLIDVASAQKEAAINAALTKIDGAAVPAATKNNGVWNLGPGGFAGAGIGTNFNGIAANGTILAMNAATGATYALVDLQIGGTSVFFIGPGGGGTFGVQSNGLATFSISRRAATIAPPLPTYLNVTAVADTGLTLGADVPDVFFNLGAVRTWATGALATQRFVRIDAPTIAFAAASTATDVATLAIAGAPIQGANATLTNPFALWIQSGGARVQGHLFFAGGTAPTAAAGSNAGTGPPAPVVTGGASDTRGNITFGTGTTPAAGNMVVVTFGQAFVTAPLVLVSANNALTEALNPCVTAISTTQFTLTAGVAPAASQANTVYSFTWYVMQ